MTSDQVEVASGSNFGHSTELQWLTFLMELIKRLTTNNIQEISQFALKKLVQETGAALGDIKLIFSKGGTRTSGNFSSCYPSPSLQDGYANFIALCNEGDFVDSEANPIPRIPCDQEILRQVVETGEPVFVQNYEKDAHTSYQFCNFGIGHLGIFPIFSQEGTVSAVLTLETQDLQSLKSYPNYDAVTAACRVIGLVMDRERTERERKLAEAQPGSKFDEEYLIPSLDGNCCWIRDRATPLAAPSNEARSLVDETARSIQERKQQEERLRLLESVIVNANDSVVITEANSIDLPGPRIIYANAAFTRLTGYSLEEVLGKTPRILQGPRTNRKTLAKLRGALRNWQPILVELINYRKDGSEFWVELSIVPVTDQNGWHTHWVAIQRDVTHRKQLEEELLKTLEQERELSELKSRFVSMTSHEFRTPLSTILSAAELVEYYGHRWTEEERIEQLHLIQDTVQHMTQLLEDILLIGQAEADRLEFHPTIVHLSHFCYDLITQIQHSVGKHHVLTFVNQCFNLKAWVDEKLLRQILTNLLSNGIKYSPTGQTVQLELTCDGNQAIFRIQDQGFGIPPEDHARLFEAFHRAKNVGAIQGSGLGLAIVKRCVDAHGGSITFHSEVGVGTTFEVMLPLEGGE